MSADARFEGKLYRALNPIWASRPLSGDGAARHGGRFNPVGMPALYCSLDPLTALREANQVGDLQPTTLVAFDAAVAPLFDARSPKVLAGFEITPAAIADSGWRQQMLMEGESVTQKLVRQLYDAGFAGIIVRSFTRGANEDDLNIVLWRWGDAAPCRLTLIDDENRLR